MIEFDLDKKLFDEMAQCAESGSWCPLVDALRNSDLQFGLKALFALV